MTMREALADEGYEDTVVFENPSYDTAIIGVSYDGRAIYDYELMITWLMNEQGWNRDSAVEWIDYNTLRALDYYNSTSDEQADGPIVMYRLS